MDLADYTPVVTGCLPISEPSAGPRYECHFQLLVSSVQHATAPAHAILIAWATIARTLGTFEAGPAEFNKSYPSGLWTSPDH